jgi:hypothetical protein
MQTTPLLLAFVVLLGLLIILINRPRHANVNTEGFQSDATASHAASHAKQAKQEDAITPDEFSFALLQSVMGPIRRLSSHLLDMQGWKERIAQSRMTPAELARQYITAPPS